MSSGLEIRQFLGREIRKAVWERVLVSIGPFAHGLSLDDLLEEHTGWWEEVESALRSHAGRTIGVDGLRAHGDGWLRCSIRT